MNETFYTKETIKTIEAVEIVASLPIVYQMKFIDYLFRKLDEESKKLWFDRVASLTHPEFEWLEIESFMETCFLNDLTRKPKDVAVVCMNEKNIDPRRKSQVIKLAQKVKKRITTRLRYKKK